MTSRILVHTSLLTATMMMASTATAQRLTVALTPAKPLYVQGEPVSLRLIVTNGMNDPAWLSLSYPSFDYAGVAAITLDVIPDHTTGAQLKPAVKSVLGGALLQRIPRVPVGPGQSWAVDVFLQRLAGDVGPGTHAVTYSIRIPSQIQSHTAPGESVPGPSDNSVALGSGSFSIAIAAGSAAELADVLAGYEKGRAGEEGDDFWKPHSAEEALCVTPSPMVIPYLADVIKTGQSDCGVRALEKFRGNREAEELLVETARSNRTAKAVFAIELLGAWGYVLSTDDLSQILNKNLAHLSVPALEYAAKIGRRDYLSIISPRTNDADLAIALAARRAEKALLGAPKW
jgi:hypothetical protein